MSVIVALLRDQSSDPAADLMAFADALVFNWLIAGTDAHAKNGNSSQVPGQTADESFRQIRAILEF
jgi:hypothetical protein